MLQACRWFCNNHRKTPVLKSLFHKVTGLKAWIFVKKDNPTQVFSCGTSVHYTSPKFYVMMDIRYLKVVFCYCKIRPRSRNNFTIDQSKFLVKRCFFLNQDFNFPSKFFSLFNHFAFTKTWKEVKLQRETSCPNWKTLVSNFSKYI